MGSGRTRSTTPDLFSTASATAPLSPAVDSPPSSPTTDDGGAAASSPSYALPTNLVSALGYLDDDQLARLHAAVIGEQKQRGKNLPVSVEPSRKKPINEVARIFGRTPMAKRSAKLRQSITALPAMVGSLMTANSVHTAELTVLSPQAMKPALSDLIPQFESSSGNQVTISYSSASALVKEIQDGKMADLAILSPKQIEQLQDEGKIVEHSIVPIAKLAFGVIIRRGTTKPDVRTVHGLKQTLMSANSIASGDPESSASGKYFANLIERLQIADAIKPKIKTFPSGTAALEAVAHGEADVVIWVISSANGPGTELAGVLPAQAKKSNSYAAGILANSNQIQAAKALSSFLSSPASLAVMKSKGFDAP
jgi:molybdate transport system substrate-binding protein